MAEMVRPHIQDLIARKNVRGPLRHNRLQPRRLRDS